jgi:hypothetical protein
MLGRTNPPSRPSVQKVGVNLTSGRTTSRFLLALALLLVPAAGSPGDKKEHDGFFVGHDGEFEADADADVFAGPTPLAVKFSASTQYGSGRVTYHWNFDDGTTSGEQNPSHTFRRHGWYGVTMDARDASGHEYQMNLLLHAWRPKDWERLKTHVDLRIMRHAARELENKRRRDAITSGTRAPANDAPTTSSSTTPR